MGEGERERDHIPYASSLTSVHIAFHTSLNTNLCVFECVLACVCGCVCVRNYPVPRL